MGPSYLREGCVKQSVLQHVLVVAGWWWRHSQHRCLAEGHFLANEDEEKFGGRTSLIRGNMKTHGGFRK